MSQQRYTVEVTASAEKALRKLEKSVRRRVLTALDRLTDEPRPAGCIKLTGAENTWRIRVDRDWRVLYEVRNHVLLVLVVEVEHCPKSYRDRR